MPESEITFTRYFAELPDPRVDRTGRHRLDDILAITLCAVIGGADSFEEIARSGEAREGWLRRFLARPHGTPSRDTPHRALAALDRGKFAECFGDWMADPCATTGLRPIAVDGKAVRAAPADTFSGCPHPVSARATENGVALGPVAVADGSHGIAAAPEWLEVSDLTGGLVTLDAAGCQKGTPGQVREQGGDYLVAVKGSQPALPRAARAAFDRAREAEFAGCDMSESAEDGHGRREGRYVTVTRDPGGLPPGWAGVAAVVVVGREREVRGSNAGTCHFYLTSLRAGAAELGRPIRGHWGIESGLHWCPDVAFREDANRTRGANAGADLGVARRAAASLLEQDPGRGSIQAKRLSAARDEKYLERVRRGFKAN